MDHFLRYTTRFSLCLCILLLVAGCSKTQKDSNTSTEEQTQQEAGDKVDREADGEDSAPAQEVAKDREATPPTGIIHVIDAGSKPRRALKLDLAHMKTGTSESLTEATTNIQGQSIVTPRVRQRVSIESLEPKGDKLIVTMKLEKATYEKLSDDPMHLATLQAMQAEEGLSGTIRFEIDETGRIDHLTALNIESGQGTDQEALLHAFAANMEQMSTVLPTEKLGVGATWTQSVDFNMEGLATLAMTVQYTIEELNDDHARIGFKGDIDDLTTAMVFDEDLAQAGALKAGAIHSTGTMRFYFDRIHQPSTQDMDLEMTFAQGDSEAQMKMHIRQSMKFVD